MGLDPSLALMHTDLRYRSSLSADLEPGRPAADALVLDFLQARELGRGDIVETREGVCRVGPSLVPAIAAFALTLRAAVAPHAERLGRTLSRSEQHPTPLTRTRHRASISARV
jgi:hypothetical protein